MPSELTANPGVYVIEVRQGLVKVGRSQDTDTRIRTHLRNARSIGADPYRYKVIPVPVELLVVAEREAHAAVRALGGSSSARADEVFAEVYYNPALAAVQGAVDALLDYARAKAWLAGLSDAELEREMGNAADDVKLVLRRLVRT